MSWRLSVCVLVYVAIGCSDGTSPLTRPTSPSESAAALPVDPTISVRIAPNLDGNNITVTGFNRYDNITGYVTTGSTARVFRSRTSIQYFTPPAGFQPGNFFLIHAGINDYGQVAGGIINDTSQRAYIWWAGGGTTLLPPVVPAVPPEGPLGCGAWTISDSGYVVGTCMPNVNWFATEWAPGGTVIKNACCGVLTAIAENQYLTGYDLKFDPPIALLWPPGASYYTLIGLNNGQMEESEGRAVNTSGWAAGWAFVTGADSAALLWVPGQPQRILSHLGVATGVDTWGNVVGYHRDTPTGPTTAFLWDFATGAHFLPGLPGGGATGAVAINNVNPEILGWAFDSQGVKHTVIWTFHRS
jgi:hypothetical protein